MGSLTQRTVTGLFWQSTVAGANVVIRTIVLIILARHLPAAAFGVVAAAMVVTTITQVFSQLGVTQALVQRLQLTDRHVRTGFAIAFATGLSATVLLFVGAAQLAAMFRIPEVEPVLRFLSLLLLFNGIAAVPIALLQRAQRFKLLSSIELIAFSLGYGAIGLALTFAGFGVWALAIAQMAQVVIRTLLYVGFTRPPVAFIPRRAAVADLFHSGLGFSTGQIGNLVATQIDYFIVGRLLGAEPLGLYNRAYQFLMLPAQLLGTAAATVLFPSMASIQDDRERVARAYLRAIGVIAMITLPLSGALIVVAPELVTVALGERWEGMVVPFQLLIATLMFRTSYKISDSVALAMGSMYQRAWRQWAYAGAVAAGALAGVRWGLPGVSAGVALAVVANFLMMLQLALKLTGVSGSQVLAVHLRHLAAGLPIILAVSLAVGAARQTGVADALVLLAGLTGGAVAALLMWWKCRWLFGADGEWAHGIAAARLPLLRAKS